MGIARNLACPGPKAPDVLNIKALAEHTSIGPPLPADSGDCEQALAEFAKAGVNADSLAAQLQDAGARSFVKSWNDLMDVIQSKCDTLKGPALKAGG